MPTLADYIQRYALKRGAANVELSSGGGGGFAIGTPVYLGSAMSGDPTAFTWEGTRKWHNTTGKVVYATCPVSLGNVTGQAGKYDSWLHTYPGEDSYPYDYLDEDLAQATVDAGKFVLITQRVLVAPGAWLVSEWQLERGTAVPSDDGGPMGVTITPLG